MAWGAHTARSEELADAVGGIAFRTRHPRLRSRRSAPVRYALDLVRTLAWLARERPTALVVQNPPPVLVVVGLVWRRRTGRPLILDSHPVAFGRKGRRIWAAFLPLHRFAARRSRGVMVTVDELGAEIRAWGGRAVVVHESPPKLTGAVAPPEAIGGRPRVLFAGVYAPDEPVAAVLAAAERLPGVDFAITGDVARAPAGLADSVPANVELVGYLAPADYWAALAAADVVLALTTEATSVIRAAYEATYALRPLVTSDTAPLRELFPDAAHVAPDGEAIAAGLAAMLAARPDLHAARERQQRRWDAQLDGVRRLVGVGA